jgi:hypothetical protein
MSEADLTPTAVTTPRIAATVSAAQGKRPRSKPKL